MKKRAFIVEQGGKLGIGSLQAVKTLLFTFLKSSTTNCTNGCEKYKLKINSFTV